MNPTPAAIAYLGEAARTWELDEAKVRAALMRDGVIVEVDGCQCLVQVESLSQGQQESFKQGSLL